MCLNSYVFSLSTNADIFIVTLVSSFLTTALYITGSIVDNGGMSSGLLQTAESVCVLKGRGREGAEGVANFNMLLLSSHSI